MARAAELNQLVQARWTAAREAGKRTLLPSEQIRFEDVERTCACGQPIETIVGKLGRRVVLNGATICVHCAGEREVVAMVQMFDRTPNIQQLLAAAGVNVHKHGECTIENWEGLESSTPITAANDFVRDVLAAGRSSGVCGLFLCGDTGTGKTHLATGILRALLLNERIEPSRVVFDRAARLITEVQDTYGTGGTEKVLAKREGAAVWVLDDLGAEKATEDVLRILTDLFSAREGRPNVITSNYEPGQMADRWEGSFGWKRLASRLGPDNFSAIRVKGRDRRLS